jgi:ATP-dependent DNA ligase
MFKCVKKSDGRRFVKYVDADDNKTYKSEVVNDPSYSLLPPLYTIAKTGKKMVWKVWVLNDTLFNMHGYVDGKLVVSRRIIKGKNEGKANSTTPEQQALLVAKRTWAKKLDKNYAPDSDDEDGTSMYEDTLREKNDQGGTNHGIGGAKGKKKARIDNLVAPDLELSILPMHAISKQFSFTPGCYKYYRDAKKERYSFYVDRKLDGYRCIARVQSDGGVVLTSRTGKQFPWLARIRKAVQELLADADDDIILDGELYTESLLLNDGRYIHPGNGKGSQTIFGIIQSAASMKRTEPSEYEDQLEYHIFDVVDTEKPQIERYTILDKLFSQPIAKTKGFPIKRVKSTLYAKKKASEIQTIIEREHALSVEEGDEGLIVRATDLMYEPKHRSQKMKKVKGYEEGEFMIVGAKECEGTEAGCVKWVCEYTNSETEEKDTFDVRPVGTFDERRTLYKNRHKYIGALLTVRYQQVTEDGAPRFCSGRSIRREFEAE